MFWKKKKEINPWQASLIDAIQKLNTGELSQLKTVYHASI